MANDSGIDEQLIVALPQADADAIPDTADKQGARVIHRFGPRVMIVELPKHKTEQVRSALPNAEVAAHPNELSPKATEKLDPVGALGLAAFQLRKSPEHISAKERSPSNNVAWDCGGALLPPEGPPELQDLAQVDAAAPMFQMARRGTSQRMTGNIVVSVIIVSGPANRAPSLLQFSPEENAKITAKVINGLSWWAKQNPAANITWIHEPCSVQIDVQPEPTNADRESYWRNKAMRKLGYTIDGWKDVYKYPNSIRSKHNADWAYVAFFVKYPIGPAVAYAYSGGPHLIVQYNHPNLNTDMIDQVVAHETGHVFHAPDEIGYNHCGDRFGIYNMRNTNCAPCARERSVKCIMRWAEDGWICCNWTAWHVGFPWPPGLTINDFDSTLSAPAACVFKQRLYAFWRGPDWIYYSSSDGVTWSNGKTINYIDQTPDPPAVCVFKNKLYMFFKANDSTDKIYFTSSTDGVTWAKSQLFYDGKATPFRPSACVFNDKLYLFWKEPNDPDRISVSSSSDGVNWPRVELTQYFDSVVTAPSACVFNNTLFIFWNDPEERRIRFTQSQDGISWTEAESINEIDTTTLQWHPRASPPEPPFPCVWNKKLYLFWREINHGSIYVSSSSDGSKLSWPAGKKINLVDSTPAALAATAFQNHVYLFWKANNPLNTIYYTADADTKLLPL